MADYTPVNDFVFSAGTYSPSLDFDFGTTPTIPDQTGVIAVQLDDVAGSIIAVNAPQAVINAQLDDATGTLVGYIELTGQISAITDDVVGAFIGQNVTNRGSFSVALEDAVGGMIGNYDANVTRWITSLNASQHEDATQLQPVTALMLRDQGTRTDHQAHDQQLDASKATFKIDLATDKATPAKVEICSSQDNTIRVWLDNQFVREQGIFIDLDICIDLDQASDTRINSGVVMEQMTKVYPDRWVMPIQDSGVVIHDFLRPVQLEPTEEYRYTPGLDFNFNAQDYAPSKEFEWTYGQTGYMATSHNYGVARNSFNSTWSKATGIFKIKRCSPVQEARRPPPGKSPWIDLPRPEPPPTPPTGGTIDIPAQRVYRMKNTITVTLEDLTPIDMDDITLSLDADSHAWQFSGKLQDPNQAALIRPDANGDAVKLIVTINSKVWTVLAEKAPETRSFNQRNINVTGRGISALISDSYITPTTGLQGSDLTVAQLADLHKPIGWTVNWTASDWLVPGGAYSWQNRSPLQAIYDLAQAAGAVLVPDTENQVLTIKQRYPVLPWNFAGVTPDVTIPDAAITEITLRPTSRQYPNGVYVHGGEVGGQIGFCRLNGTAGDVLAETTTNAIMTNATGLRAVGERILAGEYTQPEIESLTTWMDGTTIPLIEVGTFIQATIDGQSIRGIVAAVEIQANRPTVKQTIRIGEDTGNEWRSFMSLLPADPLLIGTISSTSGTTSTITLLGGGVMTVRGTGTVGNKYYIRSGQIQGEAPNMTESEIII